VVATVDVEVLGHRRPQVGDVVVGDVESGATKPIDGLAKEVGVEGGDAVDDQGCDPEPGACRTGCSVRSTHITRPMRERDGIGARASSSQIRRA
jgi:hypothetical protein